MAADEWDDLLPDDLATPEPSPEKKGLAKPVQRSPRQVEAARKRAEAEALQAQGRAESVRLAQIINLHIGGYSLAEIGNQIGATEAEVDALINRDTARFIRHQPALRMYVRNWVSEKFLGMIEADYDIATNKTHSEKLEHQDRVSKMLVNMARLHGAEAPTQSEVKVDASPKAVEEMVHRLAQGQGQAYDMDVFDVVPGSVVTSAHEESRAALEVSGNAVEEADDDDQF